MNGARRARPGFRLRLLASCVAGALALVEPGLAQTPGSYFATVDTDHNGRIELPEFQERMSWAFRQMDRNHDQVLSTDEQLVPGSPTLTLAELRDRLAAQFRRQDKNHNGWLSAGEFLAPPG